MEIAPPASQASRSTIRSTIAAVIPAYREEKHIGDVVRRTRQMLEHVLVVDDGSSDKTAARAREAGAEVIVHPQNRGKGEAIKTGLRHWQERDLVWVFSTPTVSIDLRKSFDSLPRPRPMARRF